MTKTFLNDRFYLLKHNLGLIAFYALAVAGLYSFRSPENHQMFWWLLGPIVLIGFHHFALNVLGALLFTAVVVVSGAWQFEMIDIFIVAGGLGLGLLSSSLMHNATHFNFRTRKISNLVGQLCGLQQIIGFKEWHIIHVLYHHRYPDHPEKDPHPPLDMGSHRLVYFSSDAFSKCHLVRGARSEILPTVFRNLKYYSACVVPSF